jgi:hypothetical protein
MGVGVSRCQSKKTRGGRQKSPCVPFARGDRGLHRHDLRWANAKADTLETAVPAGVRHAFHKERGKQFDVGNRNVVLLLLPLLPQSKRWGVLGNIIKMSEEGVNLKEKSTFVDVVSWVFIVISGFWTFLVFIQNIVVQVAFPQKQVADAMQNADQATQMPSLVRFLISNLDFVLFGILVLAFAFFCSSVGLLRRRNWARVVFIVFLVFGLVGILVGVVIQLVMFASFSRISGGEIPADVRNLALLTRGASVVVASVISCLFGFIIKKLCSKEIRQEFVSGRIAAD